MEIIQKTNTEGMESFVKSGKGRPVSYKKERIFTLGILLFLCILMIIALIVTVKLSAGDRPINIYGTYNIKTEYVALIAIETIILQMSFMYLIISNFGKKTWLEIFQSRSTITIYVLGILVFTEFFSYSTVMVSEHVDSEGKLHKQTVDRIIDQNTGNTYYGILD